MTFGTFCFPIVPAHGRLCRPNNRARLPDHAPLSDETDSHRLLGCRPIRRNHHAARAGPPTSGPGGLPAMTMSSWFRRLLGRSVPKRVVIGARRRTTRAKFRPPNLESLEDRLAPATVQFGLGNESLLETAGSFAVPVTL